MPEKKYSEFIDKLVELVVEFITEKGIISGFIVRLRTRIDGNWYEIRRYYTAHGTPHIDVLNWRGKTKDKIWMPQLDAGEAMTFAIDDIKTNFETYHKEI